MPPRAPDPAFLERLNQRHREHTAEARAGRWGADVEAAAAAERDRPAAGRRARERYDPLGGGSSAATVAAAAAAAAAVPESRDAPRVTRWATLAAPPSERGPAPDQGNW